MSKNTFWIQGSNQVQDLLGFLRFTYILEGKQIKEGHKMRGGKQSLNAKPHKLI